MSNTKIPSPARCKGELNTPRQRRYRASRSIGSPARSTTSVKLSSMEKDNKKDSFIFSPLPSRRSVLTDNTQIEMPKRRSWWKRLDENSKDVLEYIEKREQKQCVNVEELFDADILSQEKRNYTVDLPESSDGESIKSIVLPQRKLFTQKDQAQKVYNNIMDQRENLELLQKSKINYDNTIHVEKKDLFNKGNRQRSKPAFPAALLNISLDKTEINKKDTDISKQGQVRNLFGNQLGTKRKNMFAEFLLSDSDDEISDIQPKVFAFAKKSEPSRGIRETSPTSDMTDVELDDWRLLPSSTMVESQFGNIESNTPVKKARLSKTIPALNETLKYRTDKVGTCDISFKNSEEALENKPTEDVLQNQTLTENNVKSKTSQEIGQSIFNNNEGNLQEEENEATEENRKDSGDIEMSQNISENNDESLQEDENNQNFNEEVQEDEENESDKGNGDSCVDIELAPNISVNNDETLLETEKQETAEGNQEECDDNGKNHNISKNYEENLQVNKQNKADKEFRDEVGDIEHNEDSFKSNENNLRENEKAEKENREESDKMEIGQNVSKNNKNNLQKYEDDQINRKETDTFQSEEKEHENYDKIIQEQSNDRQKKISIQERSIQNQSKFNATHDTTGRNREQQEFEVKSPEDMRNYIANNIEAISPAGRETSSTKKTRSVIKLNEFRPSLAPLTESTRISDGTNNSSVERSGWDSHRTTRKTLRQTFGKDFTPRKSLRALVMEKSAKRQTYGFDVTTKIPQACSTRLPENMHDITNVENDEIIDQQHKSEVQIEANEKAPVTEIEQDGNKEIIKEKTEHKHSTGNETRLKLQENEVKTNEQLENSNYILNVQNNIDEKHSRDSPIQVQSDDIEQEKSQNIQDDKENAVERINCQKMEEIERRKDGKGMHNSDSTQVEQNVEEMRDSQEAEVEASNEEIQDSENNDIEDSKNVEVEASDEEIHNSEYNEIEENDEEMEDSQNVEVESSDEEMQDSENNENKENDEDMDDSQNGGIEASNSETLPHDVQENEESEDEKGDSEGIEERESSEDVEAGEESDQEMRYSEEGEAQESGGERRDSQDNEVESEEEKEESQNDEIEESDEGRRYSSRVEEESDEENGDSQNTRNFSKQRFFINDSTREQSSNFTEESNREDSLTRRQNIMEIFQKLKQQNQEMNRQAEHVVQNYLKRLPTESSNVFKVPQRPKAGFRHLKPVASKSKAKAVKLNHVGLENLPPEVLEDLKYKPPKRYRPSNASWITKRLYKYLETKLEPKYDYKARVRAEKLVETLYEFTKETRRRNIADSNSVDSLKNEMARLGIVSTHFEFNQFFHDFMPREIRIKVVPDIVNKISVPKHGIFSNIIR